VAQGLALRQDMLRCGRTGSEAGSWVLAEGHEAEAGRRALVWAAEHRTALSSPASWYYYPSRVERGGGPGNDEVEDRTACCPETGRSVGRPGRAGGRASSSCLPLSLFMVSHSHKYKKLELGHLSFPSKLILRQHHLSAISPIFIHLLLDRSRTRTMPLAKYAYY